MITKIIEHALMITSFVLAMMLIIEYLTVQTRGSWSVPLQKSSWLQILFAAFLGLLPGCLGAFVAVTLYAHRIMNFAALVTVMIATSGDEAFVMFSEIPGSALEIMGIIFFIAISVGFLINIFVGDKSIIKLPEHYTPFHHNQPDCVCFDKKLLLPQLRRITFQRALLLTVILFFFIFLIQGEIGPHEWNWKRWIFVGISLVGLFIIATVPDHFISKHLWEHIIKKHLVKIFLWTFGALLFIHYGMEYLSIKEWMETNQITIILIAVLVGIIPESGPHIVFITLFANGSIPFSVLIANSIVQDGHAALPLLAESKKSFVAVKAVNLLIGLIVGFLGYFGGW